MVSLGQRFRDLFRSLQLTLVLSIVVPLLLFSGIAIYIGLGAVERALNDRLREDLELVARAVTGPVANALSQGDELVLGESLKSIFQMAAFPGPRCLMMPVTGWPAWGWRIQMSPTAPVRRR